MRSPDMILVYEIPSDSTNIQLAIQANSTWFSAGQSVSINWGDGSAAETVSNTGGSTYIGHTYASAGTYTIKISGSMTMYGRGSAVDIAGQELLTRIDSFGKLGITSFSYAFRYCTGLTSVPKTLPSTVTNMYQMFYYCSGAAFNPDVSNWNVSKVTNMYSMFHWCSGAAFNPDVSNWNVSKVTNMYSMFRECRGAKFNPDVSKWDVSNEKNISWMFGYCSGASFNPDVSKWDVSKITNMSYIFYNCSGAAFNPDVSKWNMSNITDMTYLFRNCYGAKFNPDVSKWDVSKVENMYAMFEGCSGAAFRGGRGDNGNGIANWQLKTGDNPVVMTQFMLSSKTQDPPFLDEILNAWAALHADGKLPTNITVDFGSNKYTAAGETAYNTVRVDAGWTIASGGLQA